MNDLKTKEETVYSKLGKVERENRHIICTVMVRLSFCTNLSYKTIKGL